MSNQLELQVKAAKRLLRTQEARDDLLTYMKLTMPDVEDVDDADRSAYEETPQARLLCQVMEKVERRDLKRVAVSIGPQLGKSAVLSRGAPSWMIGKNPRLNLILGTYNQPFANEFGDAVRDLVEQPWYPQVFPGVELRKAAADLLVTTAGGRLAFVGRGGSGTGKPADIFLVDDPLKDDKEAQSNTTRDEVWRWFNKVALTRCHSRSAIVIVHCMTGDTPITMADGTRRPLASVRPGDEVLAWGPRGHEPRRVLNFAEQGEDEVFEIKTGSSTVRANARHPFLCMRDGEARWVKTADLRLGDALVTSAVEERLGAGRIDAEQAWLLGFMFGDGWLTRRDTTQVNTSNGRRYPRRGWVTCAAFSKKPEADARVEAAFDRLFGVQPRRTRHGYWRTEVQRVGQWFAEHGLAGTAKTKVLPPWLFAESLAVRRAFVEGFLHADGTIDKKNQSTIAGANEALIRDIRHLARSTGICVSNMHSWSGTVQPPNSPEPVETRIWSFKWGLRRASEAFHTKAIRSIEPAGRAVVYDIQVEGAENFIADGLVTHNTRWHQDDLIGRLCDPEHPERHKAYKGISDRWTYINLPAVVDDPKLARALGLTLEPQTNPDVISMFGSKPMSSIWPGRKDLEFLAEAKRMDPPGFGALYMGQPTPEDGDFFKADWLVEYDEHDLPKNLEVYGASDHAVSEKQDADYTVLGCVGVDEDRNLWVLPDLVWERMQTDRTVDEIIGAMERNKPNLWWLESELISKSFGPFLFERMRQRGCYLAVDPVIVAKDKRTRARAIQGRLALKTVRFPRFAPWWQEARKQLLRFPNATHDDFVDFLAHIGQGLLKQYPAQPRVSNDNAKPLRTGSIEWILSRARREAEGRERRKAMAGW